MSSALVARAAAAPETGIPHILFVIPGEESGPRSSMVFARRQAETIRAMGAQTSVFFLRSRTSPVAILRECIRFQEQLRATRPQLIHAHYGTVTALFCALNCGRIPLVITYRGSDLNVVPTARTLRSWMGRLFSQIAALKAARIVCVSRKLRDRLWWRRHLATVLPSGVDPEVFRPESRSAARARLGWPDQERVVLFNAGAAGANKRLDLAEAAVRLAARTVPHLRLEVLNGRRDPDEMPALMNAADCLLVTSDAEGSPTVMQEALASNLPVVSVDTGDAVERLRGVTNTRIVARRPEALARALAELTKEPLRSDGRRRIQEISAIRIAESLCRVYMDAVRSKGA
jgi:teichuronic acid biosynthesis glycosyltransferase TuaC